MSSSSESTVFYVIPLFNIIIDHVEDTASRMGGQPGEGWVERLQNAANAAREKIVQYYSKTNTTTMVCTALDPRRRFNYFVKKGFPQDEIDATKALQVKTFSADFLC
jgi:hypothetical protein